MTTSPSHRKLSTAEAGRLLGGVSRSTARRRAETNDLPIGWKADKEMRAQGEAWVFYVPADDPCLALLDAPPLVPAPPESGPLLETPYSEPILTVPEIRDALIAPLVARLADVDRQATTRGEMIRVQAAEIGRFQVLVEVAQQQVAALTEQVTRLEADRETQTAEVLRLASALGAARGDVAGLRESVQTHRELTDTLRALLAGEQDRRQRAEVALARPWWRRLLGRD